MKLEKPTIKFCTHLKLFTCTSIAHIPGEMSFLTGEGQTPRSAYEEWKVVVDIFLDRQK